MEISHYILHIIMLLISIVKFLSTGLTFKKPLTSALYTKMMLEACPTITLRPYARKNRRKMEEPSKVYLLKVFSVTAYTSSPFYHSNVEILLTIALQPLKHQVDENELLIVFEM